jgi:hypothetical protein
MSFIQTVNWIILKRGRIDKGPSKCGENALLQEAHNARKKFKMTRIKRGYLHIWIAVFELKTTRTVSMWKRCAKDKTN